MALKSKRRLLLVHKSKIGDVEIVWRVCKTHSYYFHPSCMFGSCLNIVFYRLVGSFSLVLQQVIKDGTLKINEALVNENNKIIDVSKPKLLEVEIKYKSSTMQSHD